jgi:hypothetical protein
VTVSVSLTAVMVVDVTDGSGCHSGGMMMMMMMMMMMTMMMTMMVMMIALLRLASQ